MSQGNGDADTSHGLRMDDPATFGGGRFVVRRRLGAGGMGVVYEAHDRQTDSLVALKTLARLSPTGLYLFKNEFRSLADLSHPNLVSLFELFRDDDSWFFTMEVVEGCDFLTYVRARRPAEGAGHGVRSTLWAPGLRTTAALTHAAPTWVSPGVVPVRVTEASGPMPVTEILDARQESVGPEDEGPAAPQAPGAGPAGEPSRFFDEGRLRAALAQLASGLAALHEAHKVHRDIKPSNVLVTPEGKVTILDFGLVTAAAADGDRPGGLLVGTVDYMAPEQAAFKPVGAAADWYSVGVVLHEALTGEVPIDGPVTEVLRRKQTYEPPPPRARANVPDDLDRLCTDLLRIDPAARPDGAEVLRRLSVVEAESARPSSGTFVGRAREMQALRDAFAASRKDARVAVFVHGESGVGKSAIVQHLSTAWRAEGAVVLSGRCYERESVPYKAVDGVIDELARHLATLPEAAVAGLLPDHAGLIGQAFPVTRWIDQVARSTRATPGAADPIVLRTRLFAALRALVWRLAHVSPLVVAVDDLQWADGDSLALLAEMLRAPEAPPLLFVATVRAASERDAGYRKVEGLGARIGGDVRTFRVEPLPADDARALARALMGVSNTGSASDAAAAAAAIAQAAGGHPLFIDELVRQRRLRKDEQGPARLDDALHARVSGLDPAARHVLSLVALAGTPLAQETAARAAEMDFAALSRVAAQLRAAHFVRTSGARPSDVIEPYHDRMRETVVLHLDAALRAQLHGRLAVALQASDDADPETLAIHFEGAGDPARAAELSERAGDEAARALAFDRAARLYERALALRPREGAEAAALHEKLGDALGSAGRGKDAASAYLAAVRWARPERVLGLRRRAAEQLLRSGLIEEGVDQLGVVLGSIGMELPRTQVQALGLLLARRAQLRLRGLDFSPRSAADLPPEALERIDVCWSAGVALGMVNPIAGAYFQARGVLLALRAGEPYRVARALAVQAAFAATAGGPGKERAETLLARARRCAEDVGDPFALAWCALADGMVAYLVGEFRRGHASSVRARALFESCAGVAWERETLNQYAIFCGFHLGWMKDLTEHAERGRREADERGDLFASTYVRSGVALMSWFAKDDPASARREVTDTARQWARRAYVLPHFWCFLGGAMTDLYEGDAPRAYARTRAEWPRLQRSLLMRNVQIVRAEALHVRARAALALAALRPDRREALLREAERDAETFASERLPYITALAPLTRAAIAYQRGDRGAAAELLSAAARGFDEADKQHYAAAARDRLGTLTGDGAAVAAAEAWMRAEDIRAPARMVALIAPGLPPAV